MDWGKIMIGFALVMLAAGLLVSPSSATGCDRSSTVGCGSHVSPAGATVTPYSPLVRENPAVFPAQVCGYTNQGSTP
jgi:hypothetical protein